MGKINFTQISKSVLKFFRKNSPQILTGIGISLGVSTVVLAVKATPKAMKCIDDKLKEKNNKLKSENKTPVKKLQKMEVVKATWKCYIPSGITGALSVACLIGSCTAGTKKAAAFATAYKLSETALAEYKEKVVETIGEKKEELIQHEVNDNTLKKNPASSSEVIVTGSGETLCYDTSSNRYFKSDINKIKTIKLDLNEKLMNEMYITLSEWYMELGLDATSISDDIGWTIDRGYIQVDFGAQIADDGTPCIVLNYMNLGPI